MTSKENLLRTIRRTDAAWIPYRYDGCLTLLRPRVVVRPVDGGPDDWGVGWLKTNPSEGSYPDGKPIASLEPLGALRADGVPRTDFAAVTDDLRAQVRRLENKDTLIVAYNELTLFERAQLLLGTEAFLTGTALEPDRVAAVLEVIAYYQVRLVEAEMAAGVAGVRFTDDWGTQSSMFISPEQWRRLIKPGLRRLYEAVKRRHGLVFQHSCGHIGEILPDLIEIGVDVLDPCQPRANDIFAWKRDYGDRLCFMGGLDTQGYLSFAAPDQVWREVQAVATVMGRGGGYIAAPSHSITIPEENARAMLEALAELRKRKGP